MILSSKRLLFQFAFDFSKVIPQIPKAFLDQPIFTFLFFLFRKTCQRRFKTFALRSKSRNKGTFIVLYYITLSWQFGQYLNSNGLALGLQSNGSLYSLVRPWIKSTFFLGTSVLPFLSCVLCMNLFILLFHLHLVFKTWKLQNLKQPRNTNNWYVKCVRSLSKPLMNWKNNERSPQERFVLF